jgi:hypothetical protein
MATTDTIFREAWQQFLRERGLPADETDGDDAPSLPLANGLQALLSPLEEDSGLILYTELGISTGEPLGVYRALLESMHLWRASAGVTFGIVPGTDIISASLLVAVHQGFTGSQLGEAVDRFTEVTTGVLDLLERDARAELALA